MRDPALFVLVQERPARSDALNPFVRHTASAVFHLPPVTASGFSLDAGLSVN
ncbi:hypothetical protein KCMC57_up15910 [Kitasatospora sp. CMC57]|uniref:Uncharacterized protein n=1 Tax=Kitasatospora sp. CMC57 TaxID=3231513 RepID=A0AB33JY22_9ACTN